MVEALKNSGGYSTYVWGFMKYYQEQDEMGQVTEDTSLLSMACDYLEQSVLRFAFSPDMKAYVLRQVIGQAEKAQRGEYPEIREDESLTKLLQLAACSLIENDTT